MKKLYIVPLLLTLETEYESDPLRAISFLVDSLEGWYGLKDTNPTLAQDSRLRVAVIDDLDYCPTSALYDCLPKDLAVMEERELSVIASDVQVLYEKRRLDLQSFMDDGRWEEVEKLSRTLARMKPIISRLKSMDLIY